LPRRIVDSLEGESLTDDAVGVLAPESGIAMVVGGQNPRLRLGLLRLAYLTVAAIATI